MTTDTAPRRSTRDRKSIAPTLNENVLSQDLLDAENVMIRRSRNDDEEFDNDEDSTMHDAESGDDDFVDRSKKRRVGAAARGGASRARGRGGRGRGSRGRGRGGSRGATAAAPIDGDDEATPARAPRQRRANADASDGASDGEEGGEDGHLPELYNNLTRSTNSVKAIVTDVTDSLTDKRSSARGFVDLLNTLIASCNTSAQLTLSDINNISAEEVSELVERLDRTEYILQTDTPFKRFKRFPRDLKTSGIVSSIQCRYRCSHSKANAQRFRHSSNVY